MYSTPNVLFIISINQFLSIFSSIFSDNFLLNFVFCDICILWYCVTLYFVINFDYYISNIVFWWYIFTSALLHVYIKWKSLYSAACDSEILTEHKLSTYVKVFVMMGSEPTTSLTQKRKRKFKRKRKNATVSDDSKNNQKLVI